MSKHNTDPFTLWMANNSRKATAIGSALAFLAGAEIGSALGAGMALSAATGVATVGVAWKVLSKRTVDNVPDEYRNFWVTGNRNDTENSSRVILRGYMFRKEPFIFRLLGKGVAAWEREISVERELLVRNGIDAATIGRERGWSTHIMDIASVGRYVNLGFGNIQVPFLNRTYIRPNAVRIDAVTEVSSNDAEWYDNLLASNQCRKRPAMILFMGGFRNTLAPSPQP
jgi:hypothetical protein